MCSPIDLFVLLNLLIYLFVRFFSPFIFFLVRFWARTSKTTHDIRPALQEYGGRAAAPRREVSLLPPLVCNKVPYFVRGTRTHTTLKTSTEHSCDAQSQQREYTKKIPSNTVLSVTRHRRSPLSPHGQVPDGGVEGGVGGVACWVIGVEPCKIQGLRNFSFLFQMSPLCRPVRGLCSNDNSIYLK